MQHTSLPPAEPSTASRAPRASRWRVVDIVVASVVGVALGVVFLVWGAAYNGLEAPFKALLPGAQSFVEAPFLLGAVLGGLLIRKPGAAVYVELLAYDPGSTAGFATVYVISAVLGGAIIAGTLSWLAVRALARTGALHRFAAGRDTAELV